MSGSTNVGDAFDPEATREAKDSTYAGISRLVEKAQASKAPMARLADRWSLAFLAVTLIIALAAWWFTSDPIRAVAVLVVATPCPLILAVPVALVAGLSHSTGQVPKHARQEQASAGNWQDERWIIAVCRTVSPFQASCCLSFQFCAYFDSRISGKVKARLSGKMRCRASMPTQNPISFRA